MLSRLVLGHAVLRAPLIARALPSARAPLIARALASAAPSRTALIKELRARTAAPMKKCVEALDKASGDIEEAIAELRKIGLATAQKKASRGANEGAVSVFDGECALAIVEVNSETDFVARNDTFQGLAASIARTALSSGVDMSGGAGPFELDVATLGAATLDGDAAPISEALGVAVGQLGENLVLRRACVLAAPPTGGVVCSYVHNTYSPGVGRTAAAVSLGSAAADTAALRDLGHKIAMHIVAASPLYLSRESVPAGALESEVAILREQALGEGKPEKIVDKMVEVRPTHARAHTVAASHTAAQSSRS